MKCVWTVLAGLALAAGWVDPMWACGFCYSLGGNPLALPHPRAIEIAVATRAAIEKGTLAERPLVPASLAHGGNGLVALHKIPAPVLVERWAARLPPQEARQKALSVHFLFIDTEQSCALTVRAGAVLFEGRPAPHSDARVVTTRAAFYALLSGRLSLREAVRRGVLCVEGDPGVTSVLPGAPSSGRSGLQPKE
jgi:hypothetical protein